MGRQTYARIYSDFVSSGKRLVDSADDKTREQFAQIDSVSSSFEKTLPTEIFASNYYVHPARLEQLASHFRKEPNVRVWLPIYPWVARSYERLLAIFQLLEDLLIRSKTQSHRYYAYLATEWMKGSSLRELVANKIERQNAKSVEEINEAIRDLFDDLELQLRYKYVKYTRLYSDVLRTILIEKGMTRDAEALLPIHLFLEYGAANQTLISLMGIGLSRTSALLFKAYLSLPDQLDSDECQSHINNVNLDRTGLPAICIVEIKKLQRTRS